MSDTITIDPEHRPEPDKLVRLNRKTLLTVGVGTVAALFLGLNCLLPACRARHRARAARDHSNPWRTIRRNCRC